MAIPKESPVVGENTVIGPSILISGRLTGDEDLTVRGRVEGELSLSRTLIVETSGVVKANVTVRNAIVSGVVVGNITASESVELTRDGRMVGDIRAPRVIIVDGASFRGRVDMGEAEPGRTAAERPIARPVARPAVPGRTLPALPARAPATTARTVTPLRAPTPPPAPARPGSKPLPPPPPAGRTAPPATPPAPPVVAAGAKKKVVVRKATKGR
ncbi:MAG: polymer-forming cytoskeletal protein [Myxococcaceae bacterium]|nr:polymer-forming cytoskeletal protein [Myxococcaceae bacterium]MCI0672703.1 polymer-forming cytoskeletal protein [Myxococcaceae bacterium]